MNNLSIIHFIIGPFPQYNAVALRIDQTREMGIDVQVWDVAEMVGLSPTLHTHYSHLVASIKNKHHLREMIESNREALFVTAINPEKRFFWIYFYLARYKCKHCKIADGWSKEYGSSSIPYLPNIRHFFKKTLLNTLNAINLISLPQNIFLPGNYWNNKVFGNPIVTNVNHFLYDQFLETKDNTPTQTEEMQKIILFLDEAHPTHPDWEILNFKPMDKNIYFKKMQKFFDKIENTFQLPVVISAHPKACYCGTEFGSGIFGQRQIVQGQTNKLAKKTEIFLAHVSTTRFFSLLYCKPIYLIWLEDFLYYPKHFQQKIIGFHQEVDCPILNEENLKTGFDIYSPNIERYNDFLRKYYIAKGYENINTLDIIGKKLIEECKKKEND